MEQHTVRPICVTRIGTQVVVRPRGRIDDTSADDLAAAVREVETLVLRRVVVDLEDVEHVEGAGLTFLATLRRRWSARLLNAPRGLRVADVLPVARRSRTGSPGD